MAAGKAKVGLNEIGFGSSLFAGSVEMLRYRAGARNAERWHGNVRVVVSCASAGASSSAWLGRVELAFARLS